MQCPLTVCLSGYLAAAAAAARNPGVTLDQRRRRPAYEYGPAGIARDSEIDAAYGA